MTITSYSITRDIAHGSGRRVTFRAITSEGDIHEVEGWYSTRAAADSALPTWANAILTQYAVKECNRIVAKLPSVLTLKYATKAQVRTALREAYRTMTGPELCRLAHALYAWYQAGYITVADIDAMFGTTAANRAALLNRILAKRDAYLAVQNSAGE